MLCFRCEHRARHLEDRSNNKEHCHQPRVECGMIETSKYICYMYQPCKPLALEPSNLDDPRPVSLDIFSSRVKVSEVQPDLELKMIVSDNIYLPLWELKTITKSLEKDK